MSARVAQPYFNSRPRVRAVGHRHARQRAGDYFNSRPRVRAVFSHRGHERQL